MFSGLYKFAKGDVNMLLMTYRVYKGLRLTAPTEHKSKQTHPWLEVNKNRARNVMLIVRLIEEYVFAVTTLCCPVLEDTLFVYTVFGAKPLPEDGAHYNARMETNEYRTS